MLILSDLFFFWFYLNYRCAHFCTPLAPFRIVQSFQAAYSAFHGLRRGMDVSLGNDDRAVAHESHYSEGISTGFPETRTESMAE